jgi:hypothetical protein
MKEYEFRNIDIGYIQGWIKSSSALKIAPGAGRKGEFPEGYDE